MKQFNRVPGFLYNKENMGGKSFKTEDEYEMALSEGWVEAPQDVGKNKVTNEVPEPEKSPEPMPVPKPEPTITGVDYANNTQLEPAPVIPEKKKPGRPPWKVDK